VWTPHVIRIVRVCARRSVCVRARAYAFAHTIHDIKSDALQRLPATMLPTPHPVAGNQARPSKNTVTFLTFAYAESCAPPYGLYCRILESRWWVWYYLIILHKMYRRYLSAPIVQWLLVFCLMKIYLFFFFFFLIEMQHAAYT